MKLGSLIKRLAITIGLGFVATLTLVPDLAGAAGGRPSFSLLGNPPPSWAAKSPLQPQQQIDSFVRRRAGGSKSPGLVWKPAFWSWTGSDWAFVPGHWELKPTPQAP